MDQKDYQLSLLRATLDASLDGILVIDPLAQEILECNQGFADMWQLPSEMVLEKNLSKFFQFILSQVTHPQQLMESLGLWNRKPKDSAPVLIELKNGRIFDCRSQALPLGQDMRGQVLFFREIPAHSPSHEIPSGQHARGANNPAFLEKILSALPSLISYVSRDYKYLYLNSAYEKWWGISRTDFIGKFVIDLVGEKQFEFYKPFLDSALNGQPVCYKADIPYKMAGLKSIEVNYIPHTLENGQIDGVFVIVHDVSDLKKTERELILQKELLKQIIENIPTALALKDVKNDFRITLGNKAAEEIFKLPREKAIGKKYYDLRPKHFAERFLSIDQKVVQEGQTIYLPEVISQAWDGQELFLQMVKVPIHSPETQEVQYILSLYTDITKEREARRALHQSAKMSSLGEMASGLAHEINNPLTIIHLFANSMREKILKGVSNPSELLDPISKIEKTAERISKIVRSLRAFSRNSESDPMQIVSFNQIFEDTLELCKERFKFKGIEIRTDIEADIRLECRASQISQVLINLLSNAYDAILPLSEKWIEFKAFSDGKNIIVSVTDSGPGIPPELQEKMMQPFFTTKEVGKGTGLGLSISKGIAEEHKGHLSYDEKSPHTRFLLKLPLRQKTQTQLNQQAVVEP